MRSPQGPWLAPPIEMDRKDNAPRQQDQPGQQRVISREECHRRGQGRGGSQKNLPLNLAGVANSQKQHRGLRGIGRRRRRSRALHLGRLGFPRRDSDLGRATGRTEWRLLVDPASATIANAFHFFTLQEPPRSWQTVMRDRIRQGPDYMVLLSSQARTYTRANSEPSPLGRTATMRWLFSVPTFNSSLYSCPDPW